MIDNIDKLKDVMIFNPKRSYYMFIALKRRKDDPNHYLEKESKTIQTWIVSSVKDLNWYMPEMKKVIEDNKCRLYMCIDRKSYLKSMVIIRNELNKYLDSALNNPKVEFSAKNYIKLLTSNSMKDESSDKNSRYWLFDIDTKDKEALVNIQIACGKCYKATFETINGYHVIAERKFNAHYELHALQYHATKEIPVELKDNALVLVATGF